MTAQIEDSVSYNGISYSVVNRSNGIQFNLSEYGIMTRGVCTACWSGYWYSYKITDDGIFLENLYVNSFNGKYPEINGVSPVDGDVDCMGHHIYRGVNIKLAYSGKILLGDRFISEYYIHGGFQRPWSYEILIELVFEDGVLIEKNDQSDIEKDIRERAKAETSCGMFFMGEDVEAFVKKKYIPSCKDKPWWL